MGGRNGTLLLNGYTVSIQEDEKTLGINGGDGCESQILGVTGLYAYNGQLDVMYVLPH